MNSLPEPFRKKIEADRLLDPKVIEIKEGTEAVKRVRRARKECQAYMRPSQGAGRTA